MSVSCFPNPGAVSDFIMYRGLCAFTEIFDRGMS